MKKLKFIGKLFGKILKPIPGSSIIKEGKEAITAIKKSKDYSKLIHFLMYIVGVLVVYWLLSKGMDIEKLKTIFDLVGSIL